MAEKTLMLSSDNDYDWLGSGIYFWEEAPVRAYEWAKWKFKGDAAVIGAKIRLGKCLNLLDVDSYKPLREAYKALVDSGQELPTNTKYYHRLDCLVINTATDFAANKLKTPYDTVRGPFLEGDPVFPNPKLFDKSHIQIAVRNCAALVELFPVDI